MTFPDDLLPGDVLLYSGTDVVSLLIRGKTWSRYSHCELYDGRGSSLAARIPLGVRKYPWLGDMSAVLRPVSLNVNAARVYFNRVNGAAYDYWGLMGFTDASLQGRANGQLFCSEFLVEALRAGGCDPFNGYPSDGIAPGELIKSPSLPVLWKA